MNTRSEQPSPKIDAAVIERDLIVHSIRSRKFFDKVKNRVAPIDPRTGLFRKHFENPQFQLLFEAVALGWLKYESLAAEQDYGLPIDDLEVFLTIATKENRLSEQDAKNLVEQIKDEIKNSEWRPELMDAFLTGTAFKAWLTSRAVGHAIKKLSAFGLQGLADLNTLRETVEEAEATIGRNDIEEIIVEPLMSLAKPSNEDEVIGPNRFGTRGAIITLIGRTGNGKSSLAVQLAICFAAGNPAFGFAPNGPLKVLIVQAENDAGDMAAMRDGIIAGLGVSEDQTRLVGQNVFVAQASGIVGQELVRKLRPILANFKPDLLILDPALAYIEGDVKEAKDVGRFLRHQLWPLARTFNCLILVLHHTNKPPTAKEATTWQAADYAYYGSGSAEWANAPRGVITLRNIKPVGVFELAVPKRGQRLGWTESDGLTPTIQRHIRHTKTPGQIFWEDASTLEVAEAKVAEPSGKPGVDENLVMMVVTPKGRMSQEDLMNELKEKMMGKNRARMAIKKLLKSKTLFDEEEPRVGARGKIYYRIASHGTEGGAGSKTGVNPEQPE